MLFSHYRWLFRPRRLRWARAIALAIGVVAAAAATAAILDLEESEVPVPTAEQTNVLKLISYLIEKNHYRKRELNDEFSEQVLETYLELLDPGRQIFLQSDIDQFYSMRHRFDDFIRTGTLKPAFRVFKEFRTRMEERVEYALDRLDMPFDFTLDEEYQWDRKEAAWAGDSDELDELWRKRIKNDIFSLRQAEKAEDEIADTLRDRYLHLARRTRQFQTTDVFQSFANAYVRTIEPHTSYFSPRVSENFKIRMSLSLQGIGALLRTDNEHTRVQEVVPGGPADRSGELHADDRIIGVAQGDEEMVDVVGWRLDDVVELIRGPRESVVRLELLPGKGGLDGQTKVIALQRDEIKLDDRAAKQRILEVDTAHGSTTVGVITLPSFYVDFAGMHRKDPNYRSTTRDVHKLIDELQERGIDGLVIDLRGNGGGSLAEAVSLTGLFIGTGPVVQVRSTDGRVEVEQDTDPLILYDGPLAVLVDRYSASASEIFAAAIQDYQRGIIIGEPTFGKGTVQHLVDLDRYARNASNLGRLKLTVAQFFRVNGDSTQHRGVVPDILWPQEEQGKPYGERAYDNALPWTRIQSAPHSISLDVPDTVLQDTRAAHDARVTGDAEFQHFFAIQHLNSERQQETGLSLNAHTRESVRARWDMRQLEVENLRLRALGEAEIDSLDALEEEEGDEEDAEGAADAADAEEDEVDPLLRESGHIVSDYRFLLGDATVMPHGAATADEPFNQ